MPGTTRSGGRNKKTGPQLVESGTFRKDRHADREAPKQPTGTPVPPKTLVGEEKAEWGRMIVRLTKAQTLSSVDDAVLYEHVQLFAETQGIRSDAVTLRTLSTTLKRTIKKLDGLELVEAVGKIVKLQEILARHRTALRQNHMALLKFFVEFYLTPLARARMAAPPKGTDDTSKKDRFFGKDQSA